MPAAAIAAAFSRVAPCRRCDRSARRTPRCSARPNSRDRSRTGWASTPPSTRPARTRRVSCARLLRQRRKPRRIEPPERPDGGAAHQRRGIVEQPLGLRRERALAAIADRDQHIAHEAVAPGALHRRFGEQRAERRIVEPRELGEPRRAQRLARRKLRLAPGLRELVPRADREAIVAAIDAVAHQRAQLARDRTLVLDRQVRDAAPRIEPVGRGKRIGRADVEAGRHVPQ